MEILINNNNNDIKTLIVDGQKHCPGALLVKMTSSSILWSIELKSVL